MLGLRVATGRADMLGLDGCGARIGKRGMMGATDEWVLR